MTIPGSGKTRFARSLHGIVVGASTGLAHAACFRSAIQADYSVIVDNTNLTVAEAAPYVLLPSQMRRGPPDRKPRNFHTDGQRSASRTGRARSERCSSSRLSCHKRKPDSVSPAPFWARKELMSDLQRRATSGDGIAKAKLQVARKRAGLEASRLPLRVAMWLPELRKRWARRPPYIWPVQKFSDGGLILSMWSTDPSREEQARCLASRRLSLVNIERLEAKRVR